MPSAEVFHRNTGIGVRESPEPSRVYFYGPIPVIPLSQEAASGGERSLDIGCWAHDERSHPRRGEAMGLWDGPICPSLVGGSAP
jgi:hypothetical protein